MLQIILPLSDESMEELEEAPPVQPKPLSSEEIAAIEKREVVQIT